MLVLFGSEHLGTQCPLICKDQSNFPKSLKIMLSKPGAPYKHFTGVGPIEFR